MLDGVLFFPVTPFGADGTVDYEALAEHVRRGLAAGPGGVFVACGTGEFHALEAGEYASIPPLVDPTPEHVEQLAAIIAAGQAAAAGLTGEVSQPQMVG
jgi:dihydrodipicolinate synthase/N-acetylneuraminate lyase